MNIKYYLSNAKNECTIRACIIADRSHQFKVNTSLKIEPKHWDKKKQQAKKNMLGHEVFNESLAMYRLDLLKVIRTLKLEGNNEWLDIKNGILNHIHNGNYNKHKSAKLVTAIDLFLEHKQNEYRKETIRKYHILTSLIQQFEGKVGTRLITSKLDFTIVEQFRQYVLFDRNNRNDTAYRTIASLKCALRWLIRDGYRIHESVFSVKQPVKSSYEIVTLSEDEVQKIINASVVPVQQKIKDCFLFMIYTGQRFSDMQQLSPDQVKNHLWVFRSTKTDKLMHIPFVGWTAEAEIIAKKYNYRFPQYTSQYFNRALKLICRNAGLDTRVRLTRYQGSKEIIIDKPKHQLISSHTARRTAVSLLLAKGVPPTVVMKLTGHTDIKTMMKYERTTTEALERSLLEISKL